jgi:Zn-dependent M16 (insulinase) family peptidase
MNVFELIRESDIPELRTHARLWKHLPTGAEILSLENDDENKVFGITFRTPPPDSTGLPHIMEHAVLAGSQKYPVKDPFIELMKGSLATFVNAMTFPDMTTYPVASQNLQDFYNLMDVYVDAVLHPLLSRHTLMQEGWRYELESIDAPLTYQGVVFNEMKGAYSSPDGLLSKYSIEALFPGHPYGRDAGGDPHCIPDLSYEQFKAFYQAYYHPSNARIYFYGDDDPQERLRRVVDYLSEFNAAPTDSKIPLMPAFDKPKWLEFPYDATDDGNPRKGYVTVNWMLGEPGDPELSLGLTILNHILTGTPASPLRKALIESGLGEDLAGDGLETYLRQNAYSIGLKGILPGDAARVESLILECLTGLFQNGLDDDTIAASVNTIEFRLRENNTGQFPRGLSLMLRALTAWLHGKDPVARLAFEVPLGAIKSRLTAKERYFENLIKRLWLNNPHRVTVLLKPDPELHQREAAAEEARLREIRDRMNEEQLSQIMHDANELKRRQETPDPPEALAAIPVLRVADLDKENKIIPLQVLDVQGTQLFYHDIFTNGIVYLDVGFDMHCIPQPLLPLTPLFGRALVEIGTKYEDYVKLSLRIGRNTGGIRPSLLISPVNQSNDSAAWLFVRGKATPDKANELLNILKDILLSLNLDNQERFRQMVLEEKAELEASLIPAGNRFVNTRLRAHFDQAGWLSEQIGGISYLFYLRNLAEAVERDWGSILTQLQDLYQVLVHRNTMIGSITLDGKNWTSFQPRLEEFLQSLPSKVFQKAVWDYQVADINEGLTIPSQVNYVGKAVNLYACGYQFHGSAAVILNYLRTTWLYERVRLQGGAYGSSCSFDHRNGVFSYLSYRDPNLLSTLENYAGSGRFLCEGELSQAEVDKSIIGAIGDLDAYLLPDARGFSSTVRFLTGETEAERQKRREQILQTNEADFRALGQILTKANQAGVVAVLGSQEAIEAAISSRPGFLSITRVL